MSGGVKTSRAFNVGGTATARAPQVDVRAAVAMDAIVKNFMLVSLVSVKIVELGVGIESVCVVWRERRSEELRGKVSPLYALKLSENEHMHPHEPNLPDVFGGPPCCGTATLIRRHPDPFPNQLPRTSVAWLPSLFATQK